MNLIQRLKRLKNLGVKDKLILTFAGGVGLYILLSISSYYFVNKTKTNINTAYAHHLSISQPVNRLKSNLYAVRNALTLMLMEEDKGNLKSLYEKIKGFTDEIDRDMEALLKSSILDKKTMGILMETKGVWEAFRDTRERELIPNIFAGRHKKAKAVALGIQAERFDRFAYLADEAVKHQNLLMQTAGIKTQEQVQRYTFLLIVITLMGVVSGFIMTVFISGDIGNRLGQVVDVAKAMAEGNLSKRVPVAKVDEIGVMAEEFNIMANCLQESYSSLERKVADRTMLLQLANDELERRGMELEFINDELRKASELKNRFLATVSHELRTPLNSVIGFAELLKGQAVGSLNEKQKEYAGYINSSGKHLLQLINNILDLSKIEAGKVELMKEDFALTPLLNDVVNTITSLANTKRLTIEVKTEDAGYINADRGKLKQVLLNLLSNAVKFNKDDGRIDIEAVTKDENLHVSVKDTGIGIKPEDVERIWLEFEQVDDSITRHFEGTGLGLAVTMKLVELHGGRIWVESEYGKGSAFKFTIPTKQIVVPVKTLPERMVISDEIPLILVVEDNLELRELIASYIKEAGYEVARAGDGNEALRLAKTLKPFAITLDLMLPEKNGWEVLRELKEDPATADIPVIIVSAANGLKDGFSFGACDYLTKPVDKESLLSSLKKLSLTTKVKRGSYTVLVVDDDPKAVELLAQILQGEGFGVIKAYGGEEGVTLAMKGSPDLVILDLMMPEVSGFEVLERLRNWHDTKDIPVIIYTAKDITSEDRARLGNEISKVVKKGFIMECLLEEVRKVEMFYPARAKMVDPLTNTFNRRYFKNRILQEISRGERYGHLFSMEMIYIDNFDAYRKKYGSIKGDEAIKKLAAGIQECTRKSDCLVRYGDFTFVLLLPQIPKTSARFVGEKIRLKIERVLTWDHERFTASVGIVSFPADGKGENELIEKALNEMEDAVKAGGNRVLLAGGA